MKFKNRFVMLTLWITLVPLILLAFLYFIERKGEEAADIKLIIVFAVIIVINMLLAGMWIYRSIISYLNDIKSVAHKLTDGSVNFNLGLYKNKGNEIGEVYKALDDMRIYFKELMDLRYKYEKETNELIANISHDLKTPLTTIKGYSEGIIDGVADLPEKRNRYIKTIYAKANTMAILVDELSFFSQIDVNSIPYIYIKVNVAEYFKDCVDELDYELELAGFSLLFINNTEPNTYAIADAEQIKRVINNIVSNAIKYSREYNGKVKNSKWLKLKVSASSEFVKVEITDNGIGIAKQDIPYIFDRMYRADASRNTRRSGTGLGLSIAQKIIQKHGGEIWAESIEGKETSIFFTLRRA